MADDAAAAQVAFQKFSIEAWTLLAIGLFVTSLRTYARMRTVGFKGLQVDDYLVWVAALFYSIETALAYCVGYVARGLANNAMTDEERVALSPESSEYRTRVTGSKIQLAGWSTYSTLLWALKASLLVFYIRLTAGLQRHYLIRIYIGFGFVIVSYITVMSNLYLACRPFRNYWQIYPDPGNACQPAISNQLLWVYLSFNISTDLYLISIPVPMLWKSSLRLAKKIGLIVLFSGGLFVVVCATLRCILIVTDPVHGAQLAGSWAVRETFVAVITTNLPMVFPLLKIWFSSVATSITSIRSTQKATRTPSGLRTFGGGGGTARHAPLTAYPITNFTLNESEERMVDEIGMHDVKVRSDHGDGSQPSSDKIRKQVDVVITREREILHGAEQHTEPVGEEHC